MSDNHSIRKVLREEIERLEHTDELRGHGPVTNYMMVLQFKDNHYHSVVPDDPKIFQECFEHLVSSVMERLKDREGRIVVPNMPGFKWID